MKTKIISLGGLLAVACVYGANAESLKPIEDAIAQDVQTVELLKAQIMQIESKPEYKKLIEASTSASNCLQYEDTMYVEKTCTTENLCQSKNLKIKRAGCDTTFAKVKLENRFAIPKFILEKYNPKCTDITEADKDGNFIKCRADNKVYEFDKLNASGAGNIAEGNPMALCLSLGGSSDGKEKSKGYKFIECKGITEDVCIEAGENKSYPLDLRFYTEWDVDNCRMQLRGK